MISRFFSTESRKAWVAGVLGALISPLFDLLNGTVEITLTSVGSALGMGLVTAIATYAVPNRPGPLPWQEALTEDFAVPAPRVEVALDGTREIPAVGGLPNPYADDYGRHAE